MTLFDSDTNHQARFGYAQNRNGDIWDMGTKLQQGTEPSSRQKPYPLGQAKSLLHHVLRDQDHRKILSRRLMRKAKRYSGHFLTHKLQVGEKFKRPDSDPSPALSHQEQNSPPLQLDNRMDDYLLKAYLTDSPTDLVKMTLQQKLSERATVVCLDGRRHSQASIVAWLKNFAEVIKEHKFFWRPVLALVVTEDVGKAIKPFLVDLRSCVLCYLVQTSKLNETAELIFWETKKKDWAALSQAKPVAEIASATQATTAGRPANSRPVRELLPEELRPLWDARIKELTENDYIH